MAKSVCYGLSSLLIVMVLSACGSGSSSSNACAVPQNVFSADKKLSIQSASSPEFEVIVRNQCASPGPITQELALDPNLQGKPGEHSYLWTPSKKFDYQTLQELAARDACVVGISEETSLVEL